MWLHCDTTTYFGVTSQLALFLLFPYSSSLLEMFKLLNAKYSRKRRVPDQGPFETMETGVATCTGLSILLVDACRSVGIPARVVGTPLWSNNSGNHTWIEVWDGDWLFTGAAEQNPAGFNRGWFVSNASQALKDEKNKAIYASSFKKTGLTFPMSWTRDVDYVNAINITERYTDKAKPVVAPGLRLMLDVFDHLFFQLPKQRKNLVEVERNYPVTVQIIAGHPHSELPDRDKIADLYPNVRNPVPRELTWRLSDQVIHYFFWLHTPTPEAGKDFNVTCKDNYLTVTTDLSKASILLDGRLIEYGKPVKLELNGKISSHKLKPSLLTLGERIQRRGDPDLAYTTEFTLPLEPSLKQYSL